MVQGNLSGISLVFVVPVLAYEDVGTLHAFKRSSQIMRDKWGESLGGNFSFGMVQFIRILVIAVPLFLLGSLVNFLWV
jgi:hypothetical protein